MIKHIVIWTLHNPADAPRMKALLESCRNVVPGILALEAGIRTDGLEANADVVLYSAFESKEVLDAYQEHPDHMAVNAQVKPLCSSRTVVDYEA